VFVTISTLYVEQGLPFSFPQKLKSFRLLGLFTTDLERAYLDESRGLGEEACSFVANSNMTGFSSSPPSLHTPQMRVFPAAFFARSSGRAVD
jgi:hypothetical protein